MATLIPAVSLPCFGAVIPKLRKYRVGDIVEINGNSLKIVRRHHTSVILQDSDGHHYWVWTKNNKV